MNVQRSNRQQNTGLSYIEVLVATLLITITLVPALDALRPGIQGSDLHQSLTEIHYSLSGKMEQLLAEPFDNLDAAATAAGAHTNDTSYSDIGADVPHRVFIWHYDVDDADADSDPFSGGEDDLLWVRVAEANGSQSLQTLVSRY